MYDSSDRAVAIVGLGAILPEAMNAAQFWENILAKRYSIREVPGDRWSASDYYDPDPSAPDKTYSKIGGWVQGFDFDWKKYRIPPKVAAAMDESQKWAVEITAQALEDYGYPTRPLDLERTAVVLGTAMGGEMHYLTFLRLSFPEYAHALQSVPEFTQLPADLRQAILQGWQARIGEQFPPVTEDSMPGELANIISGRVANVFNMRGPNFITDAACAASLAALEASVELLAERKVDAVLTGGVDHNMGASSFIKFCKIGALSATGTRPFGKGADGFVMGEGAASFLLKRLEDSERDGDRVYAVIRGVGGASDGKGKGIYAPNPIGPQLAMQRAWEIAGLDPATTSLIEAHGTSTKVGDIVEAESLKCVFSSASKGSIGLGSVKSNIGHLKAGAGAAGLLKAALAIHHKILPPTLNAEVPNPGIDLERTPFSLIHEAREWSLPKANGAPRRCGVSAYGFGGTNFHVVLEEHVPGALTQDRRSYASASMKCRGPEPEIRYLAEGQAQEAKPPVRGILALGADTTKQLTGLIEAAIRQVEQAGAPPRQAPSQANLNAPERLVVDYDGPVDLLDRLQKAQRAMSFDSPQAWKALQAQGIFRGSGPKPGKVAFLFPGQGSQYLNMGRELLEVEPVVAQVFRDGDRVMTPILGQPLSAYIFQDSRDPDALRQAEFGLMQTEITQPAMLIMDTALYKLLGEYGFKPDMVMGHSLGEYGALIAAGVMPFDDALEAVAARGREMASFHSVEDNGWMAAVMAPYQVVQVTLAEIEGYVVAANINSYNQSVIGGASRAVEQAIGAFQKKGFEARRIPVSHAFHTRIVAPASKPLRQVLDRLHIYPPGLPVVANVTGGFYPDTVEAIKDVLEQQVASPVQWIQGLETLYGAGVRTFVEVGPKKALKGFVDDVLGSKPEVVSLFTNHQKIGELPTFNQALCGLYAAGYGIESGESRMEIRSQPGQAGKGPAEPGSGRNGDPVEEQPERVQPERDSDRYAITAPAGLEAGARPSYESTPTMETLGQMLVEALKEAVQPNGKAEPRQPYDRNQVPLGSVVITGTGLGLPGAEKTVMDPENALRILRGEQFIDLIPERFKQKVLDKRITRLVKSEDGSGRFEVIEDPNEVVRLAGRPGTFDISEEYGVPAKLVESLDITTQLAMAAGLDALCEAGIPLVQTYRQTTTGKFLPDRWLLPEALRDETGVIFASAFPGGDRMADEFRCYYSYQNRLDQLCLLEELRSRTEDPAMLEHLMRRIYALRDALEREPYEFDRRFLLRILSMGHSQFAEYIGARGPNTQVNAACASTPQAIALGEDWIRTGRCRRVIVIGGDNVTSDNLMEWIGAGFLAIGAVATDDSVEEAALPFDKRRHGTLIGMGACALVLESEDAVRERGMRGIAELLSSEASNSAFHVTRLDVNHIAGIMDRLMTSAERRFGLHRHAIAPHTVFVSHETFTPARGGSASAEVVALRQTFGQAANEIIVSNTKGFTGHAMGVGVEDVIAVKILEHGIVPPVPNHKEVDPELGPLNLSKGGRYPVQYALHLAAGFGSQVAMVLIRRIPGGLNRTDNRLQYQHWLAQVSGYDWPKLEVVKRVLRFEAQGAPTHTPAPSSWRTGTGPALRAAIPGNGVPEVVKSFPVISPPLSVMSEQFSASKDQPAAEAELPPVEMEETKNDGRRTEEAEETKDNGRKTKDEVQQESTQPSPPVPSLHSGQALRLSSSSDQPSPSDIQPSSDSIAETVLRIIAEKTGYPPEMLELDLDLEADLGIDTVKQAETFLAIRETFDIPRRDDLRLRDYPTLASVIRFVKEMRPELAEAAKDNGRKTEEEEQQFSTQPLPSVPSLHAGQAVRPSSLEAADRVPRRVPVPVLRPPLELCKPTGVTLGPDSRVVVMKDRGGVGRALVSRLEKCGVKALLLPEAAQAEALEAQLTAWLEAGPVEGVYWLPALDVEPHLEELELETWQELNRQRVKNLYRTMRCLYEAVSGPGTFLVSATRLGGLHGCEPGPGATAPLGGAVTGFTKAYKRERSQALVKSVDFEVSRKTAELAEALIAETLSDPGVVEVGYRQGDRFAIGLAEQPAGDGSPGMVLNAESVLIITGAAGGITSAIIADLAGASGGAFHLLDIVPQPDPHSPYIQLYRQDKEALKDKFIEEARTSSERPTPARIEKQIQAVEREEAALRAIEAVQSAGGQAWYHCVNLLDGTAVAAAIEKIRQRHGRIDVLVHAAGLEISRSLPDKDPQQFDLVYGVKADGFFNLLRAAKGMPIGATVAFSSVAGRFGNAGQADYSAANDLLCKLTSSLRRWRPETRGIVIDWTAWAGIGMATRGSIPKIMEMAGIEMLPPEAGIPTIRRELTLGGRRGEVVVGGRLGILTEEWDETGGLDPEKASQWLAGRRPRLLMVDRVKAAKLYGGLEVETTLDPKEQPFLHDHAMDGTPLLPGVMGTEAFAELASALAHGYRVTSVEGESFERAFKFFQMEPQTLHLIAVLHLVNEGELLAQAALKSRRRIPGKDGEPAREKVHFRANVRLTRADLEAPSTILMPAPGDWFTVNASDIYRTFFHGPAYQVLENVQVSGEQAIGMMAASLPPDTKPDGAASLMAPRLIELCLQTAGVWEIKTKGVLALPTAIGSVTVHPACEEVENRRSARLLALVQAVNGGDSFNAQVVDESGEIYISLTGYRTVKLPMAVSF